MERTTQSSTKRQKVSDAEQNNTLSVDRLSALPDGILCHILSFLPTIMSVATTILAKRWMQLWAHVPVLRFEKKISSDVIYTVILLHKAKIINKFSLSYTCHYNELQLNTWIKTAIERNVRNLVIYGADKLPRCIFTCKTLAKLSLSYCKFNPSCSPVSLPSLKKLQLENIKIQETNGKLFPCFLSGCPVLEELIIKVSIYQYFSCFDISSPTIKRLTVEFLCFNPQSNKIEHRAVIDAPALEYLKIIDIKYEHGQIKISPMPSLVEAEVCLYNDPVTLFKCLRNVKYLKLSGRFKESELRNLEEFIDRGVDGPSVRFDNLTKLELEADCRFLTKILENANNLQVLTIHEVSDYLENWKEPKEEWRACLLNSLRKVTIYKFQGSEGGFNLVRFLLGNARVLRRMEIYSCIKDKFGALQKISLFHRESRECEVAFFHDCLGIASLYRYKNR